MKITDQGSVEASSWPGITNKKIKKEMQIWREAEDLLTQDLDSTVNWFLRYRHKIRTQGENFLFSAGAYISKPGMSNEKLWELKYFQI